MDKRLVSICFKETKSLERDIIYICLEKPGTAESIRATAISSIEFNYPVRSLAGKILLERTAKTTNEYGIRCNRYDYSQFIKDIVEKNNGEIDFYDRAVEEGTNAFRAMREQLR